MWNMLHNGMGGVQWDALPLAIEHFGVDNVEALIDRLMVIKSHKKPDDDDEFPDDE